MKAIAHIICGALYSIGFAHSGEIQCGKKVNESNLIEIRNVSNYVGTEARMTGSDTTLYKAIRHFKHKSLKIDIAWIEDIEGVVKLIAIGKLPKKITDDYEAAGFQEGRLIRFSESEIVIKKIQ